MSDADSKLLNIIGHLLTELAALRTMVGVLVAESPAALEALKRIAPVSSEATLNTSLDDDQRAGVEKILEHVVDVAEAYRRNLYPAPPGEAG